MAKKFSETLKEDKARHKARADKLFEKEPEKPAGPRILDDITAAGSNGPSYEDIRHWFGRLKGLKANVTSAQGEYSNARKQCKEAGIDPAVLSALMKSEKQDPDELKLYNKALARAATAVGLELQMDLFDKSGISREAQIFDEGYKAGIAGKSTSDAPYASNAEAGQTWLAGWHLGQSRNVAQIGKTPTRDSLGDMH